MATAYNNPGGTGYRNSTVSATSNGLTVHGALLLLLDGINNAGTQWFATVTLNGTQWLQFDFRYPAIIDEAKWYQSTTTAMGTWKWQGSNNGSTWVDIGTTFTLGGATTQTQTQLNGNTTAYRYYRLLGMSGTCSSTPYLYEIEFKISYNTTNVTPAYGNIGSIGNRTSIITVSATATFSGGTVTDLINGSYANSLYFTTGSQVGNDILFDFGVPKIINEAIWYANFNNNEGVWKWQGSNDNVSWVDIGTTFNLGGVTINVLTQLNGNTTAYRYYRLLAVSGSTINIPYLQEIDFSIGVPAAQAITPTGIVPADAFGDPTVQYIVSPAGIASANVFGNPAVTHTGISITGIASAEAFGTPYFPIEARGMASGEAFGQPKINQVVDLKTTAVSYDYSTGTWSGSAWNGHLAHGDIVPGSVMISWGPWGAQDFNNDGILRQHPGWGGVGSIDYATGVFNVEWLSWTDPWVIPYGTYTFRPSINSAEHFGTPIVNRDLEQHIRIDLGIDGAELFGAPVLNQQVVPHGVDSAEQMGIPTLVQEGEIYCTGLVSQEQMGLPRLQVSVQPSSIDSQESIGIPGLCVVVLPQGIAPEDEAGRPDVVAREVQITPAGIFEEAFGQPSLAMTLYPTSVNSSELWGTPRLDLQIQPVGIASEEAVGVAGLTQILHAIGIPSAEEVYPDPFVVLEHTIVGPSIKSGEAFGSPALTRYPHRLWVLDGIHSAERFGKPRIKHQAHEGVIELWTGPRSLPVVAGEVGTIDLTLYRKRLATLGLEKSPPRKVSNG